VRWSRSECGLAGSYWRRFSEPVAGFLPQSLGPLLAALTGFLIVFGVVLIVGWIVGLALSSAVRASGLGPRIARWGRFSASLGVDHRARRGVACRPDAASTRSFLARGGALGAVRDRGPRAAAYLPAGLAQRMKYR